MTSGEKADVFGVKAVLHHDMAVFLRAKVVPLVPRIEDHRVLCRVKSKEGWPRFIAHIGRIFPSISNGVLIVWRSERIRVESLFEDLFGVGDGRAVPKLWVLERFPNEIEGGHSSYPLNRINSLKSFCIRSICS